MNRTVKSPRVLHAPAAVGGHAPQLARAERSIGVDSRCVVIDLPPSGYMVDEILAPKGTSPVRRELRRWRLLGRALRNFDVVHFNFGSSLMPRAYPTTVSGRRDASHQAFHLYARALELRDLPLLKRAGKAIFVTFQGDDARHAGIAPKLLSHGYYDDALDDRKRAWVATFDRYADGIYALNPDLLRALPTRSQFLPYASVDLEDWRPLERRETNRPLVVHAPSDRRAKGTELILAALDRLRNEGVDFDLALVEGLRREEARRIYERASLFVDQVLLGWYGGVAVELMALGTPVVAHIAEDDLQFIPARMREQLPVIRADVTNLDEVLRRLLTDGRSQLPELGREARRFVERWHDPRTVAERLLRDYESALAQRR